MTSQKNPSIIRTASAYGNQFLSMNQVVIEECFPKTHSVHFNLFSDNHLFVFIAFYEKFFDYILVVNCLILRNDCLHIKRKKIKPNNKTKWIP